MPHRAIDIMTRNPVALRSDATVADAVEVLQTLDVRHLPVIDEERAVVGVLSERDLRSLTIPRIVDEQWLGNLRTALRSKVVEVMSTDVVTVDQETPVSEIIDLLLEYKIGAIPVLDADGTLAGIVSYIDVLRGLYELEERE